ncbi:MAG: GMC family oxidoreductase [Cystobacter sp.]
MKPASGGAPAYDVAIVGAGIAGSLMAAHLVARGLRVVLLEAGDDLFFDKTTGVSDIQPLLERYYGAIYKVPNSPYPNLGHAPSPTLTTLNKYYVQQGPLAFGSDYLRIAGGSSRHWLGMSPRLDPGTFQERTLYGHAVDWPITYSDLEDWYYEAEKELGVAGDDGNEGLAGVPPRKPGHKYPLPPIPQSYSDRVVARAVEGLSFQADEASPPTPVQISSTPAARNSIPYDGRPPCQGSASCIPICPTGAKYDASVHLKRALGVDPRSLDKPLHERDRVTYIPKAVLKELVLDDPEASTPRVSGLVFKRSASEDDNLHVQARLYVLAIHAMEIPKVLLASRGQRAHGVANSSGLVGRYLMDHDIAITHARLAQPLYPFRGPRITSSIEGFCDGPFRRRQSAFRPELANVGTAWETNAPFSNVIARVAQGLTGKALREQVAWDSSAVIHIDAMIEPEPQFDSRIFPSRLTDPWGLPRPEIQYRVGAYSQRGREAFIRLARAIYGRLGAGAQDIFEVPGWFGSGHVMGTTRMGEDPGSSVCDSFGLTHDHPNLYLAGSSLFPTVGTANPTLTLAALALRTAHEIERRLRYGLPD